MSPVYAKGFSREIRGGIWIVLGRLSTGVSQIVLVMILARVMTQAQVGEIFFLVSAAGVLAVVCRFGLDVLVGKEIALLRGSGRAGAAYSVTLGLFRGLCTIGGGVILFFFLVGSALGLAKEMAWGMEYTWMGGLLGLWAFGIALQFFVGEALRGMGDVVGSVWLGGLASQLLGLSGVVLLGKLVTAPAVFGFLMLMSGIALGVGGVGAAYLFGRLGAFPRSIPGVGPFRFGATVKEALPIFFNTLVLSVALVADLWVVAWFFDAATLSVYGAAAKLGMLLSLGLVVMAGVLLPTVGEALGGGQSLGKEVVLRTWASWIGLASLIMWLILAVAGQPLLTLLYGESFSPGGGVLMAIAGGYAVGNWFGVGQQVLVAGGFGMRVLGVTVASLVLTVVLSIGFAALGWLAGVAGGVASGVMFRQYGFSREARRLCGLRSDGSLALLKGSRSASGDVGRYR